VGDAAEAARNGAPPPEHCAPVWTADAAGDGCTVCGTGFTLLERRHHCRKCGALVCHACSNEKIKLPDADSKAGESFQRVCLPCFNERGAAPSSARVEAGLIPRRA